MNHQYLSNPLANLEGFSHAAVYLRKPLPGRWFDKLTGLAQQRGRGSVEAVVEAVDDVAYLRKLQHAGMSVYYGIGLPQESILLLDRRQGYLLDEGSNDSPRGLENGRDLYLKLLWRRFGIAVALTGELKQVNSDGFFCVAADGQRDQWCRLKEPGAMRMPATGNQVQLFGWAKANTRVIEGVELGPLG